MNFKEIYQATKKLNRQRGGNDWCFDQMSERFTVKQLNGGVQVEWFDSVKNIYRRTYLKGVTLT